MPQRILALDIGSWSVKAVLLEDSMRGFKVEAVGETRVPPPSAPLEGAPASELDVAGRQAAAVRELLASPAFASVDAYVSAIPGEAAAIRFVPLPYSDPKKIEQTIAGELADLLPFEVSDAVMDHTLVKRLEGGASISLAAAVLKERVQRHLDMLHDVGLDPKFLPIDSLQLYNLYTHFLRADGSKPETMSTPPAPAPQGPAAAALPEARLVIDIGHERTIVLAASEEGIAYARVVRAGGSGVTAAIAAAARTETAVAEQLKHAEAFIASARHPAPSEDSQAMSDAVQKGLAQLVRELRRTLGAIRTEKKVRVGRIDLVGGGSRIRNLANYLAEELGVPAAPGLAVEQVVERYVDADRRTAYAAALAFALRAVGDEPVSTIDLRRGEFQYAGQLEHFRNHMPMMGAAVGLCAVLFGVNIWANYHNAIKREKAVDQQFCVISKQVIGREICEPKQALSVITQPTGELGSVKLPARSALNIAAELSDRVPKELDVYIDEMDITPERARITGDTTTFDAVDRLVAEYAKDPCYKDIKKGKLGRKPQGDRIEFQLTIRMECT